MSQPPISWMSPNLYGKELKVCNSSNSKIRATGEKGGLQTVFSVHSCEG